MRLVNLASNFNMVEITGKGRVYFSYETPIAFQPFSGSLVIRKNDWGPTTGKHLNKVSEDKSIRVDGETFKSELLDFTK